MSLSYRCRDRRPTQSQFRSVGISFASVELSDSISITVLNRLFVRVSEVMRQPMEDGVVTIARAREALSFPAKFMLIAARIPCPCGYYGDATRPRSLR